MTENQETYLLKEYDKLNNEVTKLMDETRTREKYSLTIIAVIATWIYTTTFDKKSVTTLDKQSFLSLIRLLSWIPLLITTLYGLSVLLIYKNIKWIGLYLAKLETLFLEGLLDKNELQFGWERHLDRENKKKYFVNWTWAFWIFQIVIGLTIVYKSYSLT